MFQYTTSTCITDELQDLMITFWPLSGTFACFVFHSWLAFMRSIFFLVMILISQNNYAEVDSEKISSASNDDELVFLKRPREERVIFVREDQVDSRFAVVSKASGRVIVADRLNGHRYALGSSGLILLTKIEGIE